MSVMVTNPMVFNILTSSKRCNSVSFSCLESLKKTWKRKLHMVPFRTFVSVEPEKVENGT